MAAKRSLLLEENKDYSDMRKINSEVNFFNVSKNTNLESIRKELSSRGYRSAGKRELTSLYKWGYFHINAVLAAHETLIGTAPGDTDLDKEFTYVPAIFTQGRSLTLGTVGLTSVSKKLIVYGIKQSETNYSEL